VRPEVAHALGLVDLLQNFLRRHWVLGFLGATPLNRGRPGDECMVTTNLFQNNMV
jgi:hypothetical protein